MNDDIIIDIDDTSLLEISVAPYNGIVSYGSETNDKIEQLEERIKFLEDVIMSLAVDKMSDI